MSTTANLKIARFFANANASRPPECNTGDAHNYKYQQTAISSTTFRHHDLSQILRMRKKWLDRATGWLLVLSGTVLTVPTYSWHSWSKTLHTL